MAEGLFLDGNFLILITKSCTWFNKTKDWNTLTLPILQLRIAWVSPLHTVCEAVQECPLPVSYGYHGEPGGCVCN